MGSALSFSGRRRTYSVAEEGQCAPLTNRCSLDQMWRAHTLIALKARVVGPHRGSESLGQRHEGIGEGISHGRGGSQIRAGKAYGGERELAWRSLQKASWLLSWRIQQAFPKCRFQHRSALRGWTLQEQGRNVHGGVRGLVRHVPLPWARRQPHEMLHAVSSYNKAQVCFNTA